MTQILVPISPGELIDKLTILRLKAEAITDPAKLSNIRHEQSTLQQVADATIVPSPKVTELWEALYQVNATLWEIEDDIRRCEAQVDFGDNFIALARAVYRTNDKRAEIKREINVLLGSALVEEKSYVSTERSKA